MMEYKLSEIEILMEDNLDFEKKLKIKKQIIEIGFKTLQ